MGNGAVASMSAGTPTPSAPAASPVGTILGLRGAISAKLIRGTMSSSYATGGDTFDLSSVFPTRIVAVFVGDHDAGDAVRRFVYVPAANGAPATGKFEAWVGAAGVDVEEAATANLSGAVFTALVLGY